MNEALNGEKPFTFTTELCNMKLGEIHMDGSDWHQFIRTLFAKYITRTHREICL